jgi:putative spermidine/putrescine transport system substrate-binding protein
MRGIVRWRVLASAFVVLALAALTAAGCGDNDGGGGGGGAKAQEKVGKGEGKLSVVAWAGYAEDGSTDPKVDWVTPFEKKTGCQVSVKVGNTSDEMVTLMRTGKYDTVSASGDGTERLVAGGDVVPVNTDLVPNYKDIFPALKDKHWNTINGKHYGIPHGRGANLLMWNTDKVKGNLDSWRAVFEDAGKYKGFVTAYDNPIYIADAALYLKSSKPELGIKNPYELDDKQFNAAIDLLKQQRKNIGEYWADYTKEVSAFSGGNSRVGTTWQVITNLLQDDKVPVKNVLPKENATGWSDTWMISSKSKHPNCAYKWLDWIVSPKVNAQVAEYFGEAPGNQKSCALTEVKNHCEIFHANDEKFFNKISFWSTPKKDCGDDRGSVCKDYSEWVKGWTEVKG